MQARRGILAAGVGALALAAGASVAWGCASVTSPYLNALQPNRGAVPAVVTVSGGNWVPNSNINLVWAPTGESITNGAVATSGNGSFSARVTIPASAENGKDYVAYVKATQGTTVGNTPFGVDSPAEETEMTVPAPAAVTSASTSGGTRRETQTQNDQTTAPAASTQPAGSGGIPSRPEASASDPASATVTNVDGTTSPAPAATTRERSTATASAAAKVGAPSSALVPAPRNEATAATPAPVPGTPEAVAAAAQSASGDLWSGFAHGPATAAPSLTDLPASTSGTSPLAIGMGLLSGGLVALFAGFGVADMRRRRVLATD